jgi:ketosteroid isomerase-like protein
LARGSSIRRRSRAGTWLAAATALVLAGGAHAQPDAGPAADDIDRGRSRHAEARALLDRWLETQNAGDFAGYRALYHEDFVGVRRSGPKAVSLDRRGWLEDRGRMFRKKMSVAADNLRIFAKDATARIVFTQRWSSGSYTDVGPKHLVVRRDPDGFRILREELFSSAPGGSKAAVDVAAFRRFAFVVDGEVVVTTRPDEAWAAAGPIKVDSAPPPNLLIRLRRAVDTRKLPPEVAALAGARVSVFNGRGLRCQATLGPFSLRGRVLTDEVDAPEAWGMSKIMLVAKLEGDRRACAGATWARAADLSAPVVSPATSAAGELRKRALAAFSALPESQAIQQRFARWYAREQAEIAAENPGTTAKAGAPRPAPMWFRHPGPPLSVRVMAPVAGGDGPKLVSVSASVAAGDCGDGVRASLWGLWQVDGPPSGARTVSGTAPTSKDASRLPRLVLRNQPDEAMFLNPSASVDVDGDGQLEILFDGFADDAQGNATGQPQTLENGIIRALGGQYVDIDGPELPIFICPC